MLSKFCFELSNKLHVCLFMYYFEWTPLSHNWSITFLRLSVGPILPNLGLFMACDLDIFTWVTFRTIYWSFLSKIDLLHLKYVESISDEKPIIICLLIYCIQIIKKQQQLIYKHIDFSFIFWPNIPFFFFLNFHFQICRVL